MESPLARAELKLQKESYTAIRSGVDFGYTRTSSQDSLGIIYSLAQFDIEGYQSTRTHNTALNYTHRFNPATSFVIQAGPSYSRVLGAGSHFLGYGGSVSISRSLADNVVTASYRRRSGTSIGIGSISDTETVDFTISRPLSRITSLTFNTGLYRAQPRLNNPIGTEGLLSRLSFNVALKNNWFLDFGASYRTRTSTSNSQVVANFFDGEQRQMFVSMSWQFPEFWRFYK